MAVRFGVVTRVRKLESLAFLAGSEGMAGELASEMVEIELERACCVTIGTFILSRRRSYTKLTSERGSTEESKCCIVCRDISRS